MHIHGYNSLYPSALHASRAAWILMQCPQRPPWRCAHCSSQNQQLVHKPVKSRIPVDIKEKELQYIYIIKIYVYTTELRVRAWRRKCVLIHQDEVLLEGCVWQLPAAVLTHQFDRIAATLSASAASSVQQGGRHVSSWELGAVHTSDLCAADFLSHDHHLTLFD